jgi:O-antigen ligase
MVLENNFKQTLPQNILAWLPLTLFFPVGVMYAGVLLFYISLLATGEYRAKLQRVREHPLLPAILALTAVTSVVALIQLANHNYLNAKEFLSAFWHYQIYLFLLPMLAVGSGTPSGAWQQRAQNVFFGGAIFAATLFYLNALHLLPENTLTRSYILYQGNKSILLGILLAVAAGWMLHAWRLSFSTDLRKNLTQTLLRLFALLYVIAALVLLAKTRTAVVIFALLALLMALRNFSLSVRHIFLVCALMVGTEIGVRHILAMPPPATCLPLEMTNMSKTKVALTRGICTIQQVRDFTQGKKLDNDGMRLEIYKNTYEMVAERPLTGYGIGNWLSAYQLKAKGLVSEVMTTPHNDYLLYTHELGIAGLLALLLILIQQLHIAAQMVATEHKDRAMLLAMLGLTMIVGSMFNAIFRDGLFGMAFMILLAVPLAGVRYSEVSSALGKAE